MNLANNGRRHRELSTAARHLSLDFKQIPRGYLGWKRLLKLLPDTTIMSSIAILSWVNPSGAMNIFWQAVRIEIYCHISQYSHLDLQQAI